MYYNSTTGNFVVGPKISVTTQDFFKVDPVNSNVSINNTGSSSSGNVLDIVSNSSNNNSRAFTISQGAAAASSSQPLVEFTRLTAGGGAVLSVVSQVPNTSESTYAFEVNANTAQAGGAIGATVNNANAVAAEFRNLITGGYALSVPVGGTILGYDVDGATPYVQTALRVENNDSSAPGFPTAVFNNARGAASTAISVTGGGISVTGGGDVTLAAGSDLSVAGNTTLTGNTTVGGNLSVTGTLTAGTTAFTSSVAPGTALSATNTNTGVAGDGD